MSPARNNNKPTSDDEDDDESEDENSNNKDSPMNKNSTEQEIEVKLPNIGTGTLRRKITSPIVKTDGTNENAWIAAASNITTARSSYPLASFLESDSKTGSNQPDPFDETDFYNILGQTYYPGKNDDQDGNFLSTNNGSTSKNTFSSFDISSRQTSYTRSRSRAYSPPIKSILKNSSSTYLGNNNNNSSLLDTTIPSYIGITTPFLSTNQSGYNFNNNSNSRSQRTNSSSYTMLSF